MIAENGDETSMNFLDHLKELRQKLIYSIIFFIFSFIISFYFSQSIFEFLGKAIDLYTPRWKWFDIYSITRSFFNKCQSCIFHCCIYFFPFSFFPNMVFYFTRVVEKRKENFFTIFDSYTFFIFTRCSCCLLLDFSHCMEIFFEFSDVSG